MILSLIIGILTLVAEWMIFKKMGRQGWEGIVPIYNTYVLCQELYGNGWKFLLLLIPIYNIYFVIKMNIDWAKAFNQGVGFGIGLLLLPFIFQLILAFGGDRIGMAAIPIPSPTWWRMWSTRPRMPFPATRTTTRSSNCTKQNGTGEHPVPFFHVFKRNEWKERMKKLIALLLAAVMCLSLAACSNGKAENTDHSQGQNTENTSNENQQAETASQGNGNTEC